MNGGIMLTKIKVSFIVTLLFILGISYFAFVLTGEHFVSAITFFLISIPCCLLYPTQDSTNRYNTFTPSNNYNTNFQQNYMKDYQDSTRSYGDYNETKQEQFEQTLKQIEKSLEIKIVQQINNKQLPGQFDKDAFSKQASKYLEENFFSHTEVLNQIELLIKRQLNEDINKLNSRFAEINEILNSKLDRNKLSEQINKLIDNELSQRTNLFIKIESIVKNELNKEMTNQLSLFNTTKDQILSSIRANEALFTKYENQFNSMIDELKQEILDTRSSILTKDDIEGLVSRSAQKQQLIIKDKLLKEMNDNPLNPTNDQVQIHKLVFQMEYKMLSITWNQFKNDFSDLVDYAHKTGHSDEFKFFGTIIAQELPDALSNYQNLLDDLTPLSASLKTHYSRISRICSIEEMFAKDHTQDKHDDQNIDTLLLEVRNSIQLLSRLQSYEDVQRILNFIPGKWIREDFIGFADFFLCEYQKHCFENSKDNNLERALHIVNAALMKGELKAVVIILGETIFDSNHHIARSTANNPDIPDGTISGVIRNGFVQTDGLVYRQPEVIVNKLT